MKGVCREIRRWIRFRGRKMCVRLLDSAETLSDKLGICDWWREEVETSDVRDALTGGCWRRPCVFRLGQGSASCKRDGTASQKIDRWRREENHSTALAQDIIIGRS